VCATHRPSVVLAGRLRTLKADPSPRSPRWRTSRRTHPRPSCI
jgi:hypothetical protein